MFFLIVKLIRFEKSLLSAFSVFLPVLLYTKDINLSLEYSIPIFTIVAAGFIINDINDIERDLVNNPNRVLPQKSITTGFAVFLYYFLLLITLVIIKFFIPLRSVFVFMLYLVLIINYNYLVNSFPYLKNLYVLIVTGVHLSIIFLLVPLNLFFFGCIILNILSQEILLDLRDLQGDGNTFPKIVGKKATVCIVALLQILQLLLLIAYGTFDFLHWSLILSIISTQVLAYLFWNQKKYDRIIGTLKAQMIMLFALIM